MAAQRMNATDLRYALAEVTERLRADLGEAARVAAGYDAGPLQSEEVGHYTGIRRALSLLHIWTDGEFGTDGDDMPVPVRPSTSTGGA